MYLRGKLSLRIVSKRIKQIMLWALQFTAKCSTNAKRTHSFNEIEQQYNYCLSNPITLSVLVDGNSDRILRLANDNELIQLHELRHVLHLKDGAWLIRIFAAASQSRRWREIKRFPFGRCFAITHIAHVKRSKRTTAFRFKMQMMENVIYCFADWITCENWQD